jgi:hypothetical protein
MIKQVARKADGLLLNRFLQRRFTWLATDAGAASIESRRHIDAFERHFQYRSVIHYNQRWNRIAALCDLYGSDNGQLRDHGHPYDWPAHTYADYYAMLFDHCRQSVASDFECGLGTNPDLSS